MKFVANIVFSIIVFSISIYSQSNDYLTKPEYHSLIVGKWKGYNNLFQGVVIFTFNKDKTGMVEAVGGNSFNTRYSLDTSVTPISLKIAIDEVNGDMHAIIDFLSVNSMKIKMSADNGQRTRPMTFSNPDDDETVIFKRVN